MSPYFCAHRASVCVGSRLAMNEVPKKGSPRGPGGLPASAGLLEAAESAAVAWLAITVGLDPEAAMRIPHTNPIRHHTPLAGTLLAAEKLSRFSRQNLCRNILLRSQVGKGIRAGALTAPRRVCLAEINFASW